MFARPAAQVSAAEVSATRRRPLQRPRRRDARDLGEVSKNRERDGIHGGRWLFLAAQRGFSN